MVLVSEVKESGDVEAQLRHVLQKEKNQAHTTQATQERKEEQVGRSSQVSKLKFCSFICFNSNSCMFFPLIGSLICR